MPDEQGGTLMLATPVDYYGTPAGPRFRAPTQGEHTREVLAETGRTEKEIDAMIEAGVVH